MTPARLRGVLLVLAAVALTAWAVLDARQASGAAALPAPWTAAVAIALLSVAVLVTGLEVRRWVAGRRERPLDPLVAARIAVLAKAAAYAGGALVGWYLAQAAVVLPDLVGERRTRFMIALLSALAASGLSGAGFVVQTWCRRPPHDGEDSDDERGAA
ncbi:MAG TPA: DUF3180 domain-containing protein [Kineosporiaceae bacterium]